jgi:hypothetical protein
MGMGFGDGGDLKATKSQARLRFVERRTLEIPNLLLQKSWKGYRSAAPANMNQENR